jgi:streptogramin lyase
MSPATAGYPVPGTRTSPSGIAVDGSGHLWVSGFSDATLFELNALDGSVVGASASAAGGMSLPFSVAVDAGNNIWLPDNAAGAGTQVSKFTNVTTGSAFSGGGTSVPDGIAIDGAGNVWVSNQSAVSPATTAGVSEYNNSGTALSPSVGYTSRALFNGADVGIDGSGNVWVANAVVAGTFANGTNVVEFVGAAAPVATPLSVAVATGKLGARP